METAAITRLTEREKDCLRRWLAHQTAKEIALELGISPHAVEKRLKMARAKLGVSSSLEATRLLAAADGYDQLGPQPPDLAHRAADEQVPARRHWLAGGIIMSLIIAAAIAFAWQSPGGTTAAPGGDEPTTAEQIDQVVTQNFVNTDQDHSGFIEPGEIPAPDEAAHAAVAAGDGNGDGKLDLAEYRGWAAPIIAEQAAEGRKYVEEHLSRAND